MDKVVNSIQCLSSSESDLKQLKAFLQKEEGTLQKYVSHIDEVLNTLDPSIHSLGWLFLLAVKAGAPKLPDPNKYLNQAYALVQNGSTTQIRMVPQKFYVVCRKALQVTIDANQPIRSIKLLRQAIVKSRQESDTLTPIHSMLLQACLMSKCYKSALSTLEEEIYDVSQESTTPKDFLLYFYYGGMVYVGLKDFYKALNFFKMTITTPATVLSAIVVEAYKKYVLVSLLVHGKVLQLPRYTSAVVQRHHKSSFPQYQEFANAYSTNNTEELHKVASAHAETFQKDLNLGLVKQCIQSLHRNNIQRCTQTYITLSLKDIATASKLTSPQDAEKRILRMIEQGEIFATINQKDGMVSFQDDPEKYDTANMLNYLDQNIQKVIDLGKKVKIVDESIASSSHYIQRTTLPEKGSGRWGEMEDFEGAEKPPVSLGGKILA